MKKILPAILIFIFLSFFGLGVTHAQQLDVAPQEVITAGGSRYIPDKEVKMAGNLAVRASHLLNWILEQHQWSNIDRTQTNSFAQAWTLIRNITYALMVLLVLVAAFLLITTRGESLTVKKFLPKFILAVALVTLSFSLLQFIYQLTDIVQGFALKKSDNKFISDKDLFNVGFTYGGEFGYRQQGIQFDESVWVTVWLAKLTAITYFAMFLFLLARKIILWLFLISSSIFALLVIFPQLQGFSKFWLAQFVRFLLYGPLFAVFLSGLVSIWSLGIPLNFDAAKPSESIYPTATDLVLLGPGQSSPTDNLNTPSSVIRYISALAMLWAVILLPFLLLKVLSDYFINYSVSENNLIKLLIAKSSPIWQKYQNAWGKGEATPQQGSVVKQAQILNHSQANVLEKVTQSSKSQAISAGAPVLPFRGDTSPTPATGPAAGTSVNVHLPPATSSSISTTQILKDTDLKIPNIADARADSAGEDKHSDQGKIISQSKINQAADSGDPVAIAVLSVPDAAQTITEEQIKQVKSYWRQSYQTTDVPPDPISGQPRTRLQWLKQEVALLPQIIDNLLSSEKEKVDWAKKAVGEILPFLLLGGFSKEDIIAYLKAQLEAAKEVLAKLLDLEAK